MMSVKEDFLTVGLDKNGQMDFGVRCSVAGLSYERMTQLRAMIVVAVGTMEDMWRREQMSKPENQAKQDPPDGDGEREGK
jgi:hypothetical protein